MPKARKPVAKVEEPKPEPKQKKSLAEQAVAAYVGGRMAPITVAKKFGIKLNDFYREMEKQGIIDVKQSGSMVLIAFNKDTGEEVELNYSVE